MKNIKLQCKHKRHVKQMYNSKQVERNYETNYKSTHDLGFTNVDVPHTHISIH